MLVTAQVPLIIAILTWRFVRSLRRNYELAPFVITLAVFGLSFVGLGISMYPYLIPNSITLQMAAAPASSQAFMLVGASVLVPLILAYTAWSYWVFRGKVGARGLPLTRPEEGPEEAPLARRIGWMALIWAVSVTLFGVVSLILRWWLK